MSLLPILTIPEEKQTELNGLSYWEYLQTPEWSQIRKAALEAQPWCSLCNSSAGLEVHHNTYPRHRGQETLAMLTVLCDACHTGFHHRLTVSDPRLQGLRLILQNEQSLDWIWILEGYRTQLLEEEGVSTTE